MKRAAVVLSAVLFLTVSCSHISEDERLIYVKPAAVSRSVLIEDFTGQRCVNCPNANDEIARLQQEYGDDAVIAVAIHSGPLGFYTNSRYLGLRTETGDAYFNHWQVEYQPVGMVDRSELLDFSSWNGRIRQELAKPASISITVAPTVTDRHLTVQATASAPGGFAAGTTLIVPQTPTADRPNAHQRPAVRHFATPSSHQSCTADCQHPADGELSLPLHQRFASEQ